VSLHKRGTLAFATTLIAALLSIGSLASADPPLAAPGGLPWCDVNFAPLAANFPENTARRDANDSAERVQPAAYVGGEPVLVPGPTLIAPSTNIEPGPIGPGGLAFPVSAPPPGSNDSTFTPNTPPLPRRIAITAADGTIWDLGVLARGYYINDQRIEWSGMEATFASEGILASSIKHTYGFWETSIEGQFYLNEVNGGNILENTPERASYAADFVIPPFVIDQLYIRCRNGDFSLLLGKFPSPFGRTYYSIDTNSHLDGPFIRTEAIDWRETGLLLHYEPGWFVGDLAVTNGDPDRDDNSSKALVARAGIQGEHYAAGASVKWQDGNGSDSQKEYDNYAGVDAMYRFGRFTLSGEAIYDQYGMHNPPANFNPDLDIFWGRSIYYRDLPNPAGGPINGYGYYVNLDYREDRWYLGLNYGEFYPESIGNPLQDVIIRRGFAKFNYSFTPQLESFNMLMLETSGQIAQLGQPRKGVVVLTGLQFTF
jgi:hypothetical protein